MVSVPCQCSGTPSAPTEVGRVAPRQAAVVREATLIRSAPLPEGPFLVFDPGGRGEVSFACQRPASKKLPSSEQGRSPLEGMSSGENGTSPKYLIGWSCPKLDESR